MKVICLNEDEKDKDAWNRFVLDSQAPTYAHLWQWREIIERSYKHKPVYLMVRDSGRVRGVLPLFVIRSQILGTSVVSVPYLDYGGICADDPIAAKLLLDEAIDVTRKERAGYLELRHIDGRGLGLTAKKDKVTFILGLGDNSADVWEKKLNRRVRNRVKKAREYGLEIHTGKENLGIFYRVFARRMKELGSPVYSYAFFSNILKILPENTVLFVVRRGEDVLGGKLAILFKESIYFVWGCSLKRYFNLYPHILLNWHALDYASKQGLKSCDFGRSSRGSGAYMFKKSFGGIEKELNYEYYLNRIDALPNRSPSNPKYKFFVHFCKRLPMPMFIKFGSFITRYTP